MSTLIKDGTILSMIRGDEPFVGSVLLSDDGKIESVAPVIEDSGCADVIDASGCLVLPGLIDPHRHLWMSSIRSLTGDMTTAEYIEVVRLRAMSKFEPEDVRIGSLVGALDALNSGTTTVLDFAHCMNSHEHVIANLDGVVQSGARVAFALGLNDVPHRTGGFASAQERMASAAHMASTGTGSELVTLWLSSSDVLSGTETFLNDFRLARDLGLRITLHARALDREDCPSEVDLLDKAKLLGPEILWSHMPRASKEEMQTVFESGGSYVSVPGTELRGGMGFPSLGVWRELGGRPSLGISNSAGGVQNLFDTMRLAILVQRQRDYEARARKEGHDVDEVSIPMREAVEWVTINAAEALGISDRVGTVEAGKEADLIVIRPSLFTSPVINPWATLVLNTDTSHVDTVLVRGKVVKRQGQMTADLDRIGREFRASGTRLSERVGALRSMC
ncbi:amidohydrolase family protein [Paenarthrobacter ureafaciens]|uniref:amidohydrolase family protein n=1 Tax=Paenarthrobacter ureafaciens TaxID=37931 RepID=UPI002DBA4EE6|nr:amidohydrolase family protein [Paenarthrobacter ureafaciens]MEC3854121.1 amidohydrolase family protein [Paenarthrobacter ureafaciens]